MFNHERLKVYQKTLCFLEKVEAIIEDWDKRHAITDHFDRATESVLINLAESCREISTKQRNVSLDISLGSVFESAACLDIAKETQLSSADVIMIHKRHLLEICRMLIGLRNSSSPMCVREDKGEYKASVDNFCFHHENLDVYRVALKMIANLAEKELIDQISNPLFRKIDTSATCIVLNIAEGNGRYAELDHKRFIRIANQAAVKLAALLDYCAVRELKGNIEFSDAKELLERVAQMTKVMGK